MSIPLIGMIVFDLLLLWWLGKWVYHTFFLDKAGKKRLLLSKMVHQFKHKRQWDRDELSQEQQADLAALHSEAEALLKDKAGARAIDKWMTDANRRWQRLMKHKSGHAARETIEILVVVIGVVMGLRGLYLQPFKIPTGSMQPSLFGIHFVHDDGEVPIWPKRFVDGINFSRRYVNAVAKEDCRIERLEDAGGFPVRRFLLPKSKLTMSDGSVYLLPGAPTNVQKYLVDQYMLEHPEERPPFGSQGPVKIRGVFEAGDPIARGYLQLGDHLFVDRLSYQFRDPKRGDIVVFITDGVVERGYHMSGRYYIKRLVGLPGETLQIRDRRLYVKAQGADEFRLVDGSDHPAFERIYSMKGGNRGYSHAGSYMLDSEDTFELGPDEYFMMGDNSENSADSRFWGVVERDEIVGRAFVVYWPFLRRWGFPDNVPEQQFASPPTR